MDYESFKESLRDTLSPKRYKHTLGVAETAVRLAKKYGADEADAALAGVLHDMTKEKTPEEHKAIVDKYALTPDEGEKSEPKLMHAVTAAGIAKHEYALSDDIVNSIRYHTTGRANMSKLEKIIYLADYMEPSRDFDGVEGLRELCDIDLDRALLHALTMSVEEVKSKGKPVHENTIKAIDYMNGKKDK